MAESTIPVHMVNAYSSNVFHLSQQKGSRLAGLARKEIQKAEKDSYDYYSSSEVAREKAGRLSDVQYSEMEHSRRWVTTKLIYDSKLVDNEDKLKMIHDPTNEYAKAMQNSLGRKMDKVILEAAFGLAYTGKEGQTTVAFPASQTIAAFDGTTTTGVGLNVKTLRAVKKKFQQAEAIEDGESLQFVHTAEELDSMLGQTEVTNADYNSIKALVNGAVDSFMGFMFKRTELVNRPSANVTYTVANGAVGAGTGTVTASKGRECLVFARDGILFATAEALTTKLDPIPTKFHAVQILCQMNVGATRMEEKKVVKVITSEL